MRKRHLKHTNSGPLLGSVSSSSSATRAKELCVSHVYKLLALASPAILCRKKLSQAVGFQIDLEQSPA